MLEAGLIRATRSHVDGRTILYGINPRSHGLITAWLAGTQVAKPVSVTLEDHDSVREG